MVKLRRLKIERYRNVEPCDLRFSDGLNVVLGQNGAGKTTLLNLISKVLRTNLADTSDPFAIEIELTFPGGSLSGRIATREQEVTREDRESMSGSAVFRFGRSGEPVQSLMPDIEFVMRLDELDKDISIRRDQSTVLWEERSGDRSFKRTEVIESFGTRGLLAQLVLPVVALLAKEGVLEIFRAMQYPVRFDEGLDVYRTVTARADEPGSSASDLVPEWFVTSAPEAKESFFSGTVGLAPENLGTGSLTRAAAASLASAVVPHSDLAFLTSTVRLLDLQSAEARLELVEKQVSPGVAFFIFGNLKFWFTRKDGSIFQDHQLSYGQKRLLTFLYYLDCNPSFVIADELVNGMHHRWIEECVTAMGGRQAFLTSQNPLLLDYLAFDSALQVKSSFVVCQTELRDGRERMIWRNFTDDEADMFYSAYRVGIEHVGEILRTRGLW